MRNYLFVVDAIPSVTRTLCMSEAGPNLSDILHAYFQRRFLVLRTYYVGVIFIFYLMSVIFRLLYWLSLRIISCHLILFFRNWNDLLFFSRSSWSWTPGDANGVRTDFSGFRKGRTSVRSSRTCWQFGLRQYKEHTKVLEYPIVVITVGAFIESLGRLVGRSCATAWLRPGRGTICRRWKVCDPCASVYALLHVSSGG